MRHDASIVRGKVEGYIRIKAKSGLFIHSTREGNASTAIRVPSPYSCAIMQKFTKVLLLAIVYIHCTIKNASFIALTFICDRVWENRSYRHNN